MLIFNNLMKVEIQTEDICPENIFRLFPEEDPYHP